MKIILSAFNGKLKSEPMEVPDNTSGDFYMPMPMDVLAYNSDSNTFKTTSSLMKRGHFRRTNYSWLLKDLGYELAEGENPSAYEYKLVDIS